VEVDENQHPAGHPEVQPNRPGMPFEEEEDDDENAYRDYGRNLLEERHKRLLGLSKVMLRTDTRQY
jgi:hypothetical protein